MRFFSKRFVAATLIFVAAIASSKFAQDRIDTLKRDTFDEDLLYLPNDRLRIV